MLWWSSWTGDRTQMRLRFKPKHLDLRLRVVTMLGVQEDARRNDKFGKCDFDVTSVDVRCFLSRVLDSKLFCAICISWSFVWQRVCYLTISLLLICTNCVGVITVKLNLDDLHYQWICRLNKTLKQNAPQTRLFMEKMCRRQDFVM